MDCRNDYRKFVIQRWVSGKIESFQKPDIEKLKSTFPYYHEILTKYLPLLNKDLLNKHISILEIGCGWGGFIYALKRLGFHSIKAIDIIRECCDFVAERFDIHVENKDVFEFFKSSTEKFNLIIAFDVIEHFNKAEILELLSLIYEHLEHQGVVLIRVPNCGSLKGLYIRYSGFTHEVGFTKLSIEEVLKAVGFEEIKIFPEPYYQKSVAKKIIRKIIDKILSKLFTLDSTFINSGNLIAIAKKT